MSPGTRAKTALKQKELMANDTGNENNAQSQQTNETTSENTIELKLAEMRLKELELKIRLEEVKLAQGCRVASKENVEGADDDALLERQMRRLRSVMPQMPAQSESMPNCFTTAENIFEVYNINHEHRGQLTLPYLSERAKRVVAHLSAEDLKNYDRLKDAVLAEHRLAPAEYLKRFTKAEKHRNESWLQFAARMRDMYRYYLNSRNVIEFEDLLGLVVADHFKTKLPNSMRTYVSLQEGTQWLDANQLAAFCERYEEAHGYAAKGESRFENIYPNNRFESKNAGSRAADNERRKENSRSLQHNEEVKTLQRPTCFGCKQEGHQKRDCPLWKKPRENAASNNDNGRKVNSISADNNEGREAASDKTNQGVRTSEERLVAQVDNLGPTIDLINQEGTQKKESNLIPKIELVLGNDTLQRKLSAFIDSGSEITVLNERIVPDSLMDSHGTIKLRGAFGHIVDAKLINMPLKLKEDEKGINILCAVTRELAPEMDCLVTPTDLDILRRSEEESQVTDDGVTKDVSRFDVIDEMDLEQISGLSGEKSAVNEWQVASITADGQDEEIESFQELQRKDSTLEHAWKQGRENNNGMRIIDNILYHIGNFNGTRTRQLVLPKSKRKQVLELAHDSSWGGHLGSRKTLQRIRASFFWPLMTKEVKRYCHPCQTRARPLRSDRTPITPLTRPEQAFDIVFMDVIGPIVPSSARGHKYVLCLVDLCTRWPEAICLKSLNAKAASEALLRIFAYTGIPKLICSDCGTNFTASLTREMLAMLGAQVRFSTPDHPQSNGLVERWNSTFKNMLFHAIAEHEREWDKFIPFLLWAYRETPNETLGVSPFELLYARVPNGPLSILKSSWMGESVPPDGLNTPVAEFLHNLREKMKEANDRAASTAAIQQQRYATHYNLRTKTKEFKQGDLVLVLERNPGNKMAEKWEGPLTVEEKVRDSSYRVRGPGKKVRWVHADKLRQYNMRVASVAVICEDDGEFGEIISPPTTRDEGSVDCKMELSHLERTQREEITKIITTHAQVFCGGRAGLTDTIRHKIQLTEGGRVTHKVTYRIPRALEQEVDRQINELLEAGMIKPANSEVAHPIVCVVKKDGGIRLCVDFRRLNAVTVTDAYPMAHPAELLLKVAAARYITLLDLARGYWQVPMDPESQHLTVFATHRATYLWTVMPFGLKNAAATFQRLMDNILRPHGEYAMSYIDDIAVFSTSWELHRRHLTAVISELAKHGLTVNAEKCRFALPEAKYLGHIVGSGRHAPDPARVADIKNLRRPTSKTELRSFLGLCGYYREYIPNFAVKALPLRNLTGKRTPKNIPWAQEAELAYVELKNALCEIPSMFAPDFEEPFVIFTDASNWAVGACLAQIGPKGEEKPIAFASKKLSPTQVRWATIEKEAYAVIWALKRFDYWVFGTTVRVICDHNPLTYLQETTPKAPRLVRWALALQRYNLQVTHRRGTDHRNADALSRLNAE